MNQWRKQFEEHPLHKELEAVNKLLDNPSIDTKNAAILESFNRLVIVLRTFSAFVSSLNAECTVKSFLDNLLSPLSQLRPQLDQFLKNGNASHLQNANNHADQLAQRMPPFAIPETAAKQAEAVGSLASAVESLIASLTDQSKTTSEALRKLNEAAKATADNQSQLDKTIETQKARLDTAIAEFQKQFSETEAARRKQIEATEQNFKSQFEQFKDKITADIKIFVDGAHLRFIDLD